MPNPVPLILGGVQALVGALSRGELKESEKMRLSASTDNATKRAGMLANSSVAPGTDEAESRVRQNVADTIGNARMMFTDPTKIAATLAGSNVVAQRAGQAIDAASERFRANAEANYIGQLARKSQEEQAIEMENRRREMEKRTAKMNLIGSGLQNILTADSEGKMTSFLEKIYGVDLGGGGIMDFFKNLKLTLGGKGSLPSGDSADSSPSGGLLDGDDPLG